MRYHFFEWQNFSTFIEGRAGFMVTAKQVPDGGTYFNFTPQGVSGRRTNSPTTGF